MYAIVEIAGQQFKVEKDQKVFVHRLQTEEGKKVTFDNVLLLADGGKVTVGAPAIDGAQVGAKVLKHLKGDKVIVFKKKRRKGYRVKNGHRQSLTEIQIESIAASGAKKAAPAKAAAPKAKPAAKKEFNQLAAFAKELDGIEQFEKWDSAYYSEKLKQKLFNLDDEILKPYFKLENVLNGAFTIAEKLFGITFNEVFDIDKYHSDVQTFEVLDENKNLVAIFYTDFFPRKGKRNGAWMTSFKPQYTKEGINERPHVSNVCNFTPPTTTKPSLLTFNEVTTLFHEFGHGLHGMLANTTYPSLSGTSVFWDFVELPSQVMENWCYEPEALALFAKHYETGEIIPQEYVEKIKELSLIHI